MITKTTEQLQKQIEQLVREHLDAQRVAVTTAITRAFDAASSMRASAPARTRAASRRRPPTEVAGLAERLFEAVRAHPGETMAVIAPDLGEPARSLNRPMIHLKRSGRVRSAGQRSNTRYFPMASSK
jgi:hypothetical protein